MQENKNDVAIKPTKRSKKEILLIEHSDSDSSSSDEETENKPVERIKKPRSEAQIAATNKMLEARKAKAQAQLEDKQKRDEILKKEEEKLKAIVAEKIVKKAINIKKRHQTKKDIIATVLEDSESEADEPVPEKKAPIERVKKSTPKPAPPVIQEKPSPPVPQKPVIKFY